MTLHYITISTRHADTITKLQTFCAFDSLTPFPGIYRVK
jgi:hypothetical protein